MTRKVLFPILPILILLTLGAGLFLYTTENGVGLTNDSAAYIGGARGILSGAGYVRLSGDRLPRPITQFPPLYSFAIAGMSKVSGIEALQAAKCLNLICATLSLLLWIGLLKQVSPSWIPVLLGAVAFLCCGPILKAHVYGLSEALYLTLFLALLLLSDRALKWDAPVGIWLILGILCGLLMLTRYAALAALAGLLACALCVLTTWKKRLTAVILTLIGFALPAFPWLIRNRNADSGGAVNRTVTFHFPAADKLEEGIRTIAGFFLPEYGGLIEKRLSFWGIVILAALILLFAAAIVLCIKGLFGKGFNDTGLFLPIIHGAAYLAMLILDALFIDGSTVFDDRMLLPFFVLALLFIYRLCARLFTGTKGLKAISVILMLGFALLLLEDESDLIRAYHRNGQGFAGSEWTESETRLAALELGNEKTFFSNRQTFLWLINNQPSYILPPMFNAANFAERESFETERQWLHDEVNGGRAYVIVFNYQDMMADEEDRQWLQTVLADVPLKGEYADGAIFGL